MNSKQRRTLAAVFRSPTPADLAWTDLESLLRAIGFDTVEGSGSRVRFVKNGEVETFHRPHPAPEAKRYQVRQVRDLLTRLGIRP